MVNTLLEMEDFHDAVGNNFDVCVLSTACFSSGWAVNPKLNPPDSQLLDLVQNLNRLGASLVRAGPGVQVYQSDVCAARFTPLRLIQALSAEDTLLLGKKSKPETFSEILPAASKEDQASSYSAFTYTIYQMLFTRVDRWATSHDIFLALRTI